MRCPYLHYKKKITLYKIFESLDWIGINNKFY